MVNQRLVSLSTLCKGGLEERFDRELQSALKNLMDPNTDFKPKRKIVVEIELATGEDREMVSVNCKVRSVLAPYKPLSATLMIGSAGGMVAASEIVKDSPQEAVKA